MSGDSHKTDDPAGGGSPAAAGSKAGTGNGAVDPRRAPSNGEQEGRPDTEPYSPGRRAQRADTEPNHIPDGVGGTGQVDEVRGELAGSLAEGHRAPTGGDEPTAVSDPMRLTESSRRNRPPSADMFAIRGVRSELVGRHMELSAMREAVVRAVNFSAPQLITVIGNQGTGKSRLIDELVSSLPPAVRVCQGAAGKGGARYAAIGRLLRDRFAITDAMTAEQARERFRHEVQDVFGDQRVAEVLFFLGGFLDLRYPDSPFLRVLAESPEQSDEITRTVLRRFLEVDAERSPLILILDDLQWADDDTLTLIGELGSGLGGSPVVVIAAARPELMVRFANWGEGATDHVRLDLRNLGPPAAEALLRNLLARCGEVSKDIIDDAVEMTGGNPYFLEQLVRLFLANGTIDASTTPWRIDPERAAETELPISVEEAIEARIAALSVEEREVLEKGAVFGNVFWAGAVVALSRLEQAMQGQSSPPPSPAGPLDYDWTNSGEPIRRRTLDVVAELVDRDYLLELDSQDSTVAGDVELVFKHNLERELIANSTESSRTIRYHRLAAQWLETKLATRSEEQLEFLAQLYERGDDQRRAASWYLAAADTARARYKNVAAVELYEKGLSMLEEDDTVAQLEALHNLGSVLDLIGRTEVAQEQFTLMLRRAWLLDHRAKGGAAHSRLGRIHRRLGEYDQAMAHLRAANDLFTRAGDQRGIAGTLDDIGKVHWLRGAYGQALEFHRQALAIRRALGDRRSIALSLANIGRVHNDSGGFKAALRQFREALDLRREIGDLSGVVQSLCDIGGVYYADGAHDMALQMFSEAKKIAEEIGDKLALTDVHARLGQSLAAVGRGSDAVNHLFEGISLAQDLGYRLGLAESCRALAEVFLAIGQADQAYDRALRALEISGDVGSRVQVGCAHRVLAESLVATDRSEGGTARAEEHYRKAVEILAGMNNELELARCYRSFAGFCDQRGAVEEANKLRLRADEIFNRLRGAAHSD